MNDGYFGTVRAEFPLPHSELRLFDNGIERRWRAGGASNRQAGLSTVRVDEHSLGDSNVLVEVRPTTTQADDNSPRAHKDLRSDLDEAGSPCAGKAFP